jgi:hypothetical protein
MLTPAGILMGVPFRSEFHFLGKVRPNVIPGPLR